MRRSIRVGTCAVALLAGSFFCAGSGPARAADIPMKAPMRAPAASLPYDWSGFHVGVNVGYGWGSNTGDRWASHTDPSGEFGAYFAAGGNGLPGVKPKGVIGGVQVGYNWQASPNWVWGLIADFQASDMKASASSLVTPPVFVLSTTQSNSAHIKWLGTVRGKAGFALNNGLLYGTGGLAYGKVDTDVVFDCSTTCIFGLAYAGSRSSWRAGWTIGAGWNFALSRNWIFGIEYLYVDLGSVSTTALPASAGAIAVTPAVSFNAHSKFSGNILRASIDYKF
jgi:outer membrane immunogenic protein